MVVHDVFLVVDIPQYLWPFLLFKIVSSFFVALKSIEILFIGLFIIVV